MCMPRESMCDVDKADTSCIADIDMFEMSSGRMVDESSGSSSLIEVAVVPDE